MIIALRSFNVLLTSSIVCMYSGTPKIQWIETFTQAYLNHTSRTILSTFAVEFH